MKLNDWILDRYKKSKNTSISNGLGVVLFIIVCIGLFNALIANDKPLICFVNSNITFPGFNDVWADLTLQTRKRPAEQYIGKKLSAPIKYAYNTIDQKNMGFVAPSGKQDVYSLWYRHWLGTDILGRDVAAGLTRSIYNSLKVGMIATFFSFLIGTLLGIFSGIFGDSKIRINAIQFLIYAFLMFYLIFYCAVIVKSFEVHYLLLILVLISLIYANSILWDKVQIKKYGLPFDFAILKLIEVRKSIPSLVWILACLPLFKSSAHVNTIIVLSIIGWTTFARVARAETLNILNNGYMKYAESMGIKAWRMMYYHVFPNIKHHLYSLAIFGLIANIMIEASLSFLGLGLAADEISFGSMLSTSRGNLSAWWMVVFPGVLLFIIIYSLRLLLNDIGKREEI